jgi:lipopolysaccharide export system permease protein
MAALAIRTKVTATVRYNRIKILDRYIGRMTLGGILLIAATLVTLFSFFELLAQLNMVGKGNYRILDAFIYTALTLPKRIVDLMALSALLGSIIALGIMADNRELVAIQSAGMSAKRISSAVVATSVILMLGTIIIAEFVSPPLERLARMRFLQARYGNDFLVSQSGFWVRQGPFLIHVDRLLSADEAADVEIYELDESGGLKTFRYARTANIQPDQSWLLHDVQEKIIHDGVIQQTSLATFSLKSFLSNEQAHLLNYPPESLSLSDLFAYIQNLRARGQNVERYTYAFWQKICLPLTTPVMVLWALTFIFGPLRARTAGQRIASAMLIGVMFYLLNQLLGYFGRLAALPPIVTTLLPVTLLLLAALRLLKRAA